MQARWSFSLYPEAGEGGGCFVLRRQGERVAGRPDPERARGGGGAAGAGEDPPLLRREPAEPARDADLCGEGCHDPRAAARRTSAGFFRELRGGLGGEALPYLWVPQWHPGGHGLHAHFAVGRFVPRSG